MIKRNILGICMIVIGLGFGVYSFKDHNLLFLIVGTLSILGGSVILQTEKDVKHNLNEEVEKCLSV